MMEVKPSLEDFSSSLRIYCSVQIPWMFLVADFLMQQKRHFCIHELCVGGSNVTHSSYTLVVSEYHSVQCSDISFSVNSILFTYKYIKLQTNHIHNTLHLKGIQK